ncbi:uncharacterized protein LOC111408320 [Olea europaea var. sylvestris]|uniref:uncharacterized protein LOC111408320 n=1 Tax=Olea europaea var. sylvestris TaxID=158386 RepID=UPI000C1CFA46|nr:uncharacterized protein LOC111408320 [Olea europaea var. sylvestris]
METLCRWFIHWRTIWTGVVLINPEHRIFCKALPFHFKASNNEAEYEALIAGTRMASGLGISDLIIHSDSQLVINQVNGVYVAQEERMDNYLQVVRKELERFNTTELKQIPRSQNDHADALARLATSEGIEEFDSIPMGRISLSSTELDKVHAVQDVHERICGNHSSGLSLAHKIIRQEYFWPAIRRDSLEFVKRYDKCQHLAPIINALSCELNPVTAPWPFVKWGVNLIGPMPVGKGDFCEEFDIKKYFSTPNHPQANGQVKAINKIIKHTLKAKLDLFKGGRADELPSVLWFYCTTTRTNMGEIPFSLAFGVEAVIPLEVSIPSLRITDYDEERNHMALRTELDLTEEKRNNAELKNAVYKQRNVKYYNQKVQKREFEVGSLVLRKVFLPTREVGSGCLGLNWEGPYLITKVLLKGGYELEDLEGRPLSYPWNAEHLKQYYQ